MVSQLKPACAPSRMRNSNRTLSSWTGTPHSTSWYAMLRDVRAQLQRMRRSPGVSAVTSSRALSSRNPASVAPTRRGARSHAGGCGGLGRGGVVDEVGIGDAMARLGVQHQLKWLLRFLKLVHQLNRVREMHVVVDQSMDQHQGTVEIASGKARRALSIAVRILF